jgi:hypothetical protein
LYQINFLLTFNYLRPEDLPPDEPEPDEPRDELKLPDEPDELRDELKLPDEPPREELKLPEDLDEPLPEPEGALANLEEPELFLEANELPLF